MEDRQAGWVAGAQAPTEEPGEQVVIPVHAGLRVHPLHQEVEPTVQAGHHLGGVSSARQQLARLGCQLGQDAGVLEQELQVVRLVSHDLVRQVGVESAGVTVGRATSDRAPLEGPAQQLDARRPACRSGDHRLHCLGLEAEAHPSVEEAVGHQRVQPEVLTPHLGKASGGPEPGEGEWRVQPSGHQEVEDRRRVGDQVIQGLEGG